MIRGLDAQLKMIEQRIENDPRNKPIVAAAEELDRKSIAVESELFQIKKRAVKDSFNYGGRLNDMYIALEGYVERSDNAPTTQEYEMVTFLDHEFQSQIERWQAIVRNDVPAFNRLLDQGHIGLVGVSSSDRERQEIH